MCAFLLAAGCVDGPGAASAGEGEGEGDGEGEGEGEGGDGGRANFKLRDVFIENARMSFEYDDDDRLVSAARFVDGVLGGEVTLEWEADKLARILRPDVTIVLFYDGDTLTAVSENAPGLVNPSETEFAYDDDGRLLSLVRSSSTDTQTTTFEHDTAGVLQSRTQVSEQGEGDTLQRSEHTRTFTYEADLVVGVTDVFSDTVLERAMTFDANGVLQTMTFPGQDGQATAEYSYDSEGRVASMENTQADGTISVVTFEYDDGRARGVDTTPHNFLPDGLFDLTGKAHASYDATSQAIRFAGLFF